MTKTSKKPKPGKPYFPTRKEVNEGVVFKIPASYTAGQLVHIYRLSKKYGEEIRFRVNKWPYEEMTGEEWLVWFNNMLSEKIESKMPPRRGRKLDDAYALELYRLKRYIGNRIVIDTIDHRLGPRVKAALAHRMRSALDD